MAWSHEELKMLIEGRLPWNIARRMMSGPKEEGRFERVVQILQDRVSFDDRILLPIAEHLYIVETERGERVVKCDCGQAFGDYRINWKLSAQIYVRDSDEGLEDLYPGYRKPDEDWCEVREFTCPGCGALLEVEAVPPGYPIVFEFLPDLDGLYGEWLGKPLSGGFELKDLTTDAIQRFLSDG
jgi:acetone carboxylase gamma subunit